MIDASGSDVLVIMQHSLYHVHCKQKYSDSRLEMHFVLNLQYKMLRARNLSIAVEQTMFSNFMADIKNMQIRVG